MAKFARLDFIQLSQGVEAHATHVAIDARGIGSVEHRVALGPALHALKYRGKKAAAEEILPAVRLHTARDENDEARKVLVLGAQAVGHPRANRWPAWARRAGVNQ